MEDAHKFQTNAFTLIYIFVEESSKRLCMKYSFASVWLSQGKAGESVEWVLALATGVGGWEYGGGPRKGFASASYGFGRLSLYNEQAFVLKSINKG